jgi:hypothetical protein
MVKLIRFVGLVSQGVFLQFVHVVGLVAFVVAVAAGFFRMPSWSVPIMAVVFGVVADKFVDLVDLTGVLEKAKAAHERGGFMIVVYFVITGLGYVVGAYGRHYSGGGANGAKTEPEKK